MQAATPPESDDKKVWRRWLRQRLRQVDVPEAGAAAIRRHLEGHLARRSPSRIAAFAAMPGEVDLRSLVPGSPHQWCFPRIGGDDLSFHPIRNLDDLEPGAYGIDAPRAGLAPVAIEALDVLLVPGLGFGRDGSRLGRGRGFYDRVLAQVRAEVPLIAIAFDEQVVAAVPTAEHDLPVTHLLTPAGLRTVPF